MLGIQHLKRYTPYVHQKKGSQQPAVSSPLPAHIIAQFVSDDGTQLGSSINLPSNATPDNLRLLINNLLNNELPYTFIVNDNEIVNDLASDILTPLNISTENVISIKYLPQAVFKVKSITRCSSTLTGHTDAILQVCFAPDGSKLATASGDTTVRLWDLTTETPMATLSGHTNWVQCVAWSANMVYLASGSMDNTVRLWNPKTGKAMGDGMKGHTNAITSIAWEPMHKNMNCTRFASSSKDGTVRIWDAALRRLIFAISQHTAPVMAVKWGGEGVIYTASRDKTIKLWDSKDGKLIRTLNGHAHWINHISLSNEQILRTGPFDAHSGTIGLSTSFSSPLDAYNKACERYSNHMKNNTERLVSCSDDFTLFLWDALATKTPITRMTGHQQLVNNVCFSPDGRFLASAGFDKSVKLWCAKTGKFQISFRGHVGAVYQVAFSSDSRLLLSSSKDSTCKVWDLKTMKLKNDLPGHSDEVFAVDWCPMGWAGASGGKDKCLKM